MGGAVRLPIALLMILAVAGATRPATADYEAGLFAFNRGDYAAAALQFEPAAREGDADAQYWLGRLYAEGLGRPRDPVTAYVWFDRAAAQGHHDSAVLRDGLATVLTPDQMAEARHRNDRAGPADQQASGLIEAVQRELNRLGYRSGPADGIAGNRTMRAIEQFQRDTGLELTGTATASLLDRLRATRR